jgi:hypothetical protein
LIRNKYREKIGETIENSYKIEADETEPQMPTDEQIELWLADGMAKKSAKRAKTMKGLSYAAVFAIVLSMGSSLAVLPNVQASESSGATLSQEMEVRQVYKDVNELPKNIKEKFLILPNTMGQYNIDNVEVEQTSDLTSLTFVYKDGETNELVVEEDYRIDEKLMKTIVGYNAEVELYEDMEIYIGDYSEELNTASYMFIYKDVYVKIRVSGEFNKNEIFDFIKKAASE